MSSDSDSQTPTTNILYSPPHLQIEHTIKFLERLYSADEKKLVKSIIAFVAKFFQMSNIHFMIEDINTTKHFILYSIKSKKIIKQYNLLPHNLIKALQSKIYIHTSELSAKQQTEYATLINNTKEQYILIFKGKTGILALLSASMKQKLPEEDSFLRTWVTLVSLLIESALLARLVEMDRMTKLYDHHSFMKRLDNELYRAMRHGHSLTLVLLDIDLFKQCNDTYGHQVGDMIIIEVAKLLISHVRKTDIVARYGGEEFALLLPETSLLQGMKVVHKIHRKLNSTALLADVIESKITLSIGVSSLHHAGAHTSSQLIHHADKALYQSKENGRNRITIYQA